MAIEVGDVPGLAAHGSRDEHPCVVDQDVETPEAFDDGGDETRDLGPHGLIRLESRAPYSLCLDLANDCLALSGKAT